MPEELNNDYEYVVAAKEGDQAAFECLLTKYGGMIQKVARSYFFPQGTRDDVRQVARLALWEAVRDYRPWGDRDPSHGFSTFAKQVVYRKVISEVKFQTRDKRHNRERDVPLETVEEPELVEDGGNWQAIKWFLDLLTEQERTATYLLLQGYRYDEIAEFIGSNRKGVDNALQRARKKYRVSLGL